MSFSQRELDPIDGADEVEVETQAPEGPVHQTIVWAIVEDGQVFLRTVRGPERPSNRYGCMDSGHPALLSMLRPDVLGTTLRIEPT
jgi:hypothetical protein